MDKELIIISDYCTHSQIEKEFITLLEDEGLIEVCQIDGQQCLPVDELINVEKYARWYYDLSINIEGIDAIRILLSKMEEMQSELDKLRRLVNIDSICDSLNFDNGLFN